MYKVVVFNFYLSTLAARSINKEVMSYDPRKIAETPKRICTWERQTNSSPFKIPKGVPGTNKGNSAPEPGQAPSYRSYADTTKQMNADQGKRAQIDRDPRRLSLIHI